MMTPEELETTLAKKCRCDHCRTLVKAVAAEREECAKVAENCTTAKPNWGTREAIAALIRSRASGKE